MCLCVYEIVMYIYLLILTIILILPYLYLLPSVAGAAVAGLLCVRAAPQTYIIG